MKFGYLHPTALPEPVAPHWGAWIEMLWLDDNGIVRFGRTPLGCVD